MWRRILCLEFLAGHVEALELQGREVVEVVAVGADEMRKHRTRDDGVLTAQATDNLVNILFWIEV